MTNVIPIAGHVEFERNVKRTAAGTLNYAKSRKPREVCILAIDQDGEFFLVGSPPDPGNALWLMELARRKLVP